MSRASYKIIAGVLLFWLGFFLILQVLFQPSHNRDWEIGHEALPTISFADGTVTIDNFRNFDWYEEYKANAIYETISFKEEDIQSVDVFISNFAEFQGLAHIFLSFGLKNGQYVTVSLETRRESDEKFSPILGILRQYEIIYVVGSERDLVGARTGPRDERVYLYPTKATPEQAKRLFRLLAEDINTIATEPRMYNTLTQNCTNEITRRVEEVADVSFPLSWKTVMPGYFDEVLYEMGIIDTSVPFAEIKAGYLIDNTTVNADSPTYSADLRSKIAQ